MPPRNTKRKDAIRRVLHEQFNGGPVLLSELRWRVLESMAEDADQPLVEMTRSERESCNRTVRGMGDEVKRYRIAPVNNIPFGVAAREACMRLDCLPTIQRLVNDDGVIAALRWVSTASATGTLRAPEFSFWTGDPSDGLTLRCHGVVRLNNGRPVTFASGRKPSKHMVRKMGLAQWQFALVMRWQTHLLGSPQEALDRHRDSGGTTGWTIEHPFGSRARAYALRILHEDTPHMPLSGRLRTTHQGVSDWGTLYKLVRAT